MLYCYLWRAPSFESQLGNVTSYPFRSKIQEQGVLCVKPIVCDTGIVSSSVPSRGKRTINGCQGVVAGAKLHSDERYYVIEGNFLRPSSTSDQGMLCVPKKLRASRPETALAQMSRVEGHRRCTIYRGHRNPSFRSIPSQRTTLKAPQHSVKELVAVILLQGQRIHRLLH